MLNKNIFWVLSCFFVFFLNNSYASSSIKKENYDKFINLNKKNEQDLQNIAEINYFINKNFEYDNNDKLNYGENDYWTTLNEFINKGKGNCKSFALAKYFTLKKLNFDMSKFRMAYINKSQYIDMNHMILIYEDNNKFYVLDNILSELQDYDKIKDFGYTPLFTFNEYNIWLNLNNKTNSNPNKISKWYNVLKREEMEQ